MKAVSQNFRASYILCEIEHAVDELRRVLIDGESKQLTKLVDEINRWTNHLLHLS